MSRYDWLKSEIETIRTKEFHVVERLSGADLLRALNDPVLPAEYKDFVRELGRARLYRQGAGYLVGVMAPPEEARSSTGDALLNIGHYDDARAYLKRMGLEEGGAAPVFEWGAGGLRQVAEGFDEWVQKRCAAARRKYSATRWKEIVKGPKPFGERERSIVEARRKFHWEVVGVTPDGEILFRVTNNSDRFLPFLSVGIRSRSSRFEGGAWLPVSHISPGATEVIAKECYKRNLDPSDVEAFPLPDPEPEDVDRYWEFKTR